MFKRLFVIVMIAGSYWLAGCSTIEGVGKDIQKAGGVIEDAATKKK